jgi:hypothetical protein
VAFSLGEQRTLSYSGSCFGMTGALKCFSEKRFSKTINPVLMKYFQIWKQSSLDTV